MNPRQPTRLRRSCRHSARRRRASRSRWCNGPSPTRPCCRRADRYPGPVSFTRKSGGRVNRSGRVASAAALIRECRRGLAARGSSVVREVVGGGGAAEDWRHYPGGDGYDPISHAQYFYHCHLAPDAPKEVGHFHLFLRAEGMPGGTLPLLLPEAAIAKEHLPTPPQAAPLKRGVRDEVSHLVA